MTILDTIASDFNSYKSGGEIRKKVPGLTALTSIIPGRLYFGAVDKEHFDKYAFEGDFPFVPFFNVDFRYNSFAFDFGPFNLAVVYCFCRRLSEKLDSSPLPIVHFACPDEEDRVNSAFLMGCFAIVVLNLDAHSVMQKLKKNSPHQFVPYRDASCGECDFPLHLFDCLRAIQMAFKLNILDFDSFDLNEYLYYDEVRNGDLNWIIPKKMLAFCGPVGNVSSSSVYNHPPRHYFNYFKKHNVTTIVRLNNKVYDAKLFTEAGFTHEDLFFDDGTTPSRKILDKFLDICENSKGAIAVHCKAGLGRTGTLIACYMMKYYRFTANEAIAWIRICRPGSILGPQQWWLVNIQPYMWSSGRGQLKKRKDGLFSRREIKCNSINKAESNTCGDSEDELGTGLSRITCEVKKIEIKDVAPQAKAIIGKVNKEKNEEKAETQGDRLNRIKQAQGKSIIGVKDLHPDKFTSIPAISTHRHPYNTRSCAKSEPIHIPIHIEGESEPLNTTRRSTRSAKGSLNMLWKRILPMRDVAFIPPEVSLQVENAGDKKQTCANVRARSCSLARSSRVAPSSNVPVDSKESHLTNSTKNGLNNKNPPNKAKSPPYIIDHKKNSTFSTPISFITTRTSAHITTTTFAKADAKR